MEFSYFGGNFAYFEISKALFKHTLLNKCVADFGMFSMTSKNHSMCVFKIDRIQNI